MTVTRQYIMIAQGGAADKLAAALDDLGAVVATLPGCQGTELLQDLDRPERFVFSEAWDSQDAHKASASGVPKAVIGPVMGLLAEPPQGSYLAARTR